MGQENAKQEGKKCKKTRREVGEGEEGGRGRGGARDGKKQRRNAAAAAAKRKIEAVFPLTYTTSLSPRPPVLLLLPLARTSPGHVEMVVHLAHLKRYSQMGVTW